jgi:hypothetical protein
VNEKLQDDIRDVMADIKAGVDKAKAAGLDVQLPYAVHFEFSYNGMKVVVDVPFHERGHMVPVLEMDGVTADATGGSYADN